MLSLLINVSVSPQEEQPKEVFRLDQATVHRGDSGVLQLKFTPKQVTKTQGSAEFLFQSGQLHVLLQKPRVCVCAWGGGGGGKVRVRDYGIVWMKG